MEELAGLPGLRDGVRHIQPCHVLMRDFRIDAYHVWIIQRGDEAEIVESGAGCYEVLGSTEIGKIERLFDMEIEDDDFTTIAGFVINESGKVPRCGEQLTLRGLEVEVLEADERRIGRLRIKRAAENGREMTQTN